MSINSAPRRLVIACAIALSLTATVNASTFDDARILAATTMEDLGTLVFVMEGGAASLARMHTRVTLGPIGEPGDISGACRFGAQNAQSLRDVTCSFPDGLPPAGSYLLSVEDTRTQSRVDFALTIGATGLTGAQGPQGEVGVQGPQGQTGPQGETGAPGETGLQGPTGAQGDTGAQGAIGPQGDTGAQGATGSQGDTGAQGAIGPQGDTGPQGAAGPQGETGVQGLTGAQGATGPQGTTGAQGATGAMGPMGPTGMPGNDGPMGPAGATGAVGVDSLVALVTVNPGSICTKGGLNVVSGRDSNGNNVLDVAEVTASQVLCNGEVIGQ